MSAILIYRVCIPSILLKMRCALYATLRMPNVGSAASNVIVLFRKIIIDLRCAFREVRHF